jgi:hypothetical protein
LNLIAAIGKQSLPRIYEDKYVNKKLKKKTNGG